MHVGEHPSALDPATPSLTFGIPNIFRRNFDAVDMIRGTNQGAMDDGLKEIARYKVNASKKLEELPRAHPAPSHNPG